MYLSSSTGCVQEAGEGTSPPVILNPFVMIGNTKFLQKSAESDIGCNFNDDRLPAHSLSVTIYFKGLGMTIHHIVSSLCYSFSASAEII